MKKIGLVILIIAAWTAYNWVGYQMAIGKILVSYHQAVAWWIGGFGAALWVTARCARKIVDLDYEKD